MGGASGEGGLRGSRPDAGATLRATAARQAPGLYRLALAITGDRGLALTAVEQTLHSWSRERASLGPPASLRDLCARRCYRARPRRGHRGEAFTPMLPGDTAMRAAFAGLPVKQRATLTLVHREGLDPGECGAALDRPGWVARRHLRRGMAALRRASAPGRDGDLEARLRRHLASFDAAAVPAELPRLPPPAEPVAPRRRAASARAPGARARWLAAAATATLLVPAGVAVVDRPVPTGGVSAPEPYQQVALAPPEAAAAIAAAPDYGLPPRGVAVFYLVDPRAPQWMQAVDWTGRLVGTVELPEAQGSPDGSRILTGLAVYSQAGLEVGSIADGMPGIWADDNAHLCYAGSPGQVPAGGAPGLLHVLDLVGGARPVATVGRAGGQSQPVARACAVSRGRAVVEEDVATGATDWWLVDLGSGRALSHRSFPAGSVTDVVAAPDAAYVAENPGPAGGATPPATPTYVRRTDTGAPVAALARGTRVAGFSGDDSLLVLSRDSAPYIQVVSLDGRRVVWQEEPHDIAQEVRLLTMFPQPGGGTVVLALAAACGAPAVAPCTGREAARVVVVHGDGTAAEVPGSFYPAGW